MSCWAECNEDHELPQVGKCEKCGGGIDKDGKTVELCCSYSPICEVCDWSPCDHSC